jgi:hypothetical protein
VQRDAHFPRANFRARRQSGANCISTTGGSSECAGFPERITRGQSGRASVGEPGKRRFGQPGC